MTTIGASLVITGEVTSSEDITINGRVHGPVSIRDGALIATQTGRVTGEVRASRIVVHGTMDGTLSATERIELQPSAVVTGSLSANNVVIADGATFNGRIDMEQRTGAVKGAQQRAGRPNG